MKKIFILFIIGLCITSTKPYTSSSPKIIGLVQVRNASHLIENCLRALTPYIDAIIVLDDASDDETPQIVRKLAHELPIAKQLIRDKSAWELGAEWQNRQLLLDKGRELGGTHFIVIDADEMFTANCADNNFLRSLIYKLQPGDRLQLWWIQLWKGFHQYRVADGHPLDYKQCIFCDDGRCFYKKQALHVARAPINLTGRHMRLWQKNWGLLHFNYVNWQNVLLKKAWYRCLDHIRDPLRSTESINEFYREDAYGLPTIDNKIECAPSLRKWFNYPFFNPDTISKDETWRKNQILNWFEEHGKIFFQDLEIWGLDWNIKK